LALRGRPRGSSASRTALNPRDKLPACGRRLVNFVESPPPAANNHCARRGNSVAHQAMAQFARHVPLAHLRHSASSGSNSL